jgi:hypothetical protein
MFEPIFPDAEYIEFYNRSTSSFDLSGWRINGLDYTFPAGSFIAPGSFLVFGEGPRGVCRRLRREHSGA